MRTLPDIRFKSNLTQKTQPITSYPFAPGRVRVAPAVLSLGESLGTSIITLNNISLLGVNDLHLAEDVLFPVAAHVAPGVAGPAILVVLVAAAGSPV